MNYYKKFPTISQISWYLFGVLVNFKQLFSNLFTTSDNNEESIETNLVNLKNRSYKFAQDYKDFKFLGICFITILFLIFLIKYVSIDKIKKFYFKLVKQDNVEKLLEYISKSKYFETIFKQEDVLKSKKIFKEEQSKFNFATSSTVDFYSLVVKSLIIGAVSIGTIYSALVNGIKYLYDFKIEQEKNMLPRLVLLQRDEAKEQFLFKYILLFKNLKTKFEDVEYITTFKQILISENSFDLVFLNFLNALPVGRSTLTYFFDFWHLFFENNSYSFEQDYLLTLVAIFEKVIEFNTKNLFKNLKTNLSISEHLIHIQHHNLNYSEFLQFLKNNKNEFLIVSKYKLYDEAILFQYIIKIERNLLASIKIDNLREHLALLFWLNYIYTLKEYEYEDEEQEYE